MNMMTQEKRRSLMRLRLKDFIAKIKKATTFLQLVSRLSCTHIVHDEEEEPLVIAAAAAAAAAATPALKARKGHFVVSASGGGGERDERFVVELKQLRNPAFLRLLDDAKDVYGGSFRQEGTLALPCRPHELQRVLVDETY
ncbi:hypothetical protein Dimus_034653 [Dionaea muscipula]